MVRRKMPTTTTLFILIIVIALILDKTTSSSSTSPPSSSSSRIANSKSPTMTCSSGDTATSSSDPLPGTTPMKLRNSAFVFVKPHANNPKVRELVRSKLAEAGISIISEKFIDRDEIETKKLIDKHYYSIASKATLLSPEDIPVPEDAFETAFNEPWPKVLSENRAANALQALEKLSCDERTLTQLWNDAQNRKTVVKFGGGFYCTRLTPTSSSSLYVFNAFFISMRSKYVSMDSAGIYCYVVEWDEMDLSWKKFRGEVLGSTDPEKACEGSIRRIILDRYEELGLSSRPSTGDNGVHASASPFEALVEKTNWLGWKLDDDALGRALLARGIITTTTDEDVSSVVWENWWSKDPRVALLSEDGGGKGSLFDTLEDLDVGDCLEKLVALYELNKSVV